MRNKRARNKAITAGLNKVLRFRGLFTRVAKELGVDRTHVWRVARGQRQSKRVLDALVAELERIEKDATQRRAA